MSCNILSGPMFDPYWGNKRGVKEELPSQELIDYFQKTYIKGQYPERMGQVGSGLLTYWVVGMANTMNSFTVKEIQQEYREYKLKQLGI